MQRKLHGGLNPCLVTAPTSPRELCDTFLLYTKDGGLDVMFESDRLLTSFPLGASLQRVRLQIPLLWKTFFGPRVTPEVRFEGNDNIAKVQQWRQRADLEGLSGKRDGFFLFTSQNAQVAT